MYMYRDKNVPNLFWETFREVQTQKFEIHNGNKNIGLGQFVFTTGSDEKSYLK